MQYFNIEQFYMRKVLFLTAIVLFTTLSARAEDNSKLERGNEVRLNVLKLATGFAEIDYERILGHHFGVGSSLAIGYGKSDMKAMIIPFGRYYFGEIRGAGFFTELNTSMLVFNSGTNAGLGIAAGYKFISKKGWLAEATLGGGKVFNNPDFPYYPRYAISVGKRF